MSVGYVLFWIVGLSVLGGFGRELWARPLRYGWLGKYFFVVGISFASYLAFGLDDTGHVLAFFGIFLLLAPQYAYRRVTNAVAVRDFQAAARASARARWLHPFDGAWEYPALFRALAATAAGGPAPGAFRSPGVTRLGALFAARIHDDWPALLVASKAKETRTALFDETTFVSYRLLALAALDRFDELLAESTRLEKSRRRASLPLKLTARLYLFELGGREEARRLLLTGPFRAVPPSFAEGFYAVVTKSARLDDDTRLARRQQLEGLERTVRDDKAHWPELYDPLPWKTFVATRSLVALLFVAFFAEELAGGSEDGETLWRLGAVFLGPVPGGQALWRLFAASWLHFGWLHCAMNAMGLAVLGPFVERRLGRARYLLLFVLAGPASLYLATLVHRGDTLSILIGASGAVMGLVGATAALLAPSVLARGGSAAAAERLRGIALIVAVQVAFDAATPQTSGAAHLFGVGVGFLLGLVLRPRTKATA